MIEPTNEHLQEACDLLNNDREYPLWALPEDSDRSSVLGVARYIANHQPAYPPELVERMEASLAEICAMQAINRGNGILTHMQLKPLCNKARAILAELDALKPDPLVEAMEAAWWANRSPESLEDAYRTELAKRGLHITEIHND